jgi:hypothetical protein
MWTQDDHTCRADEQIRTAASIACGVPGAHERRHDLDVERGWHDD